MLLSPASGNSKDCQSLLSWGWFLYQCLTHFLQAAGQTFFFPCVFLKIQLLWSRWETNGYTVIGRLVTETPKLHSASKLPQDAWKTCVADFPVLLCTNTCCLMFFLTLQQALEVVFSSCVMLWSTEVPLVSLCCPSLSPYRNT